MLHDKPWISVKEKGSCGDLKICGLSGRFPDRRNCFPPLTLRKTKRDVHAAALGLEGVFP